MCEFLFKILLNKSRNLKVHDFVKSSAGFSVSIFSFFPIVQFLQKRYFYFYVILSHRVQVVVQKFGIMSHPECLNDVFVPYLPDFLNIFLRLFTYILQFSLRPNQSTFSKKTSIIFVDTTN